jgi:asparagine synthase (glutamine-hydrolysing)
MCGIAGVFDPRQTTPGDRLDRMAGNLACALTHRGPDDAGSWADAAAGIALAHRRLEIVGLGSQGHQPMRSQSGRWVLSYNGEVYNADELRRRLSDAGSVFEGTSDTEVLVAALDRWGLDEALEQVEGMFAFAAWDRSMRRLHLARDRFGEKPLYYGWAAGLFAFASELKAFHRLPGFRAEIDRESVAAFLRLSCVPAPGCIYRGLAKLRPGTTVTIDATTRPDGLPPQREYWSAQSAIDDALHMPPLTEPGALTDRVEAVLSQAVAARLQSDVPVGALLSGGIDSSLVVALMQRHAGQRVRTFTVAFVEEAYDESAAAGAVAAHLGTDHSVVDMTERDVFDAVPRLPEIWDEPFADSSQLPTLLVAQVAKRSVTVALSGDGGDELFAGYNRHAWLERIWRAAEPFPFAARRGAGTLLGLVPAAAADAAAAALPQRWRVRLPSVKAAKVGRVLRAPTVQDAYASLLSHWEDPSALVPGFADPTRLPPSALRRWDAGRKAGAVTDQLLRSDLVAYLPDDVLTKVDRASMAVSLEVRTPFLDRAVLEAAWRVPSDMKVHDGSTKWVLRQILDRHVPRSLVDRPKMGFGVPIDSWLRGPLRPWAEDLLAVRSLSGHGLLNPQPIRRAWELHLTGRRDLGDELWDVLMLQAFMGRWGTAASRSSDESPSAVSCIPDASGAGCG